MNCEEAEVTQDWKNILWCISSRRKILGKNPNNYIVVIIAFISGRRHLEDKKILNRQHQLIMRHPEALAKFSADVQCQTYQGRSMKEWLRCCGGDWHPLIHGCICPQIRIAGMGSYAQNIPGSARLGHLRNHVPSPFQEGSCLAFQWRQAWTGRQNKVGTRCAESVWGHSKVEALCHLHW